MTMTTLTEAERKELRRLHEAATQGDWAVNPLEIPHEDNSIYAATLASGQRRLVAIVSTGKDAPANRRLIPAMRNALPSLLDMADRLAEVEKLAQWRPIETAPKDGTPVFVTWKGSTTRAIGRTASYQERRGQFCQSGGWEDWGPGWVCYFTGTALTDKVDMWMPLPPPPTTEVRQDEPCPAGDRT